MKKIRLLLVCSFILLLFSGNAIAGTTPGGLSPGTYYLEEGTWEGFLTHTPPIINAVSLTGGGWSIFEIE